MANISLTDIILQNSSINIIQDNAFLVENTKSTPQPSTLFTLFGLTIGLTSSQLIRVKE